MLERYKQEILLALGILIASIAFIQLYAILMPFLLGLLLAFAAFPLIRRMQKVIKNRDLATTVFLLGLAGVLVVVLLFFTQYINRDFRRVNESFRLLVSDNQDQIDATAQKVKEYIGDIYDLDKLEDDIRFQVDSLRGELEELDSSQLDTESIEAAFKKVTSVFSSDGEEPQKQESGLGFLYLFFSGLVYFVLILYQYAYFEGLQKTYFSGKLRSGMALIWEDFNQSFWRYFQLRTKIILILSPLYLLAFALMNMPGMILFTLIILILSYIPYLQYLALLPIALGCVVLSIEQEPGFLLYFGITVGVFVLASILEELLLLPRIMEKNMGMNPVIMILAVSVWSYLLGMPGLLIGIPLTSLLIIYLKRYFLPAFQHYIQENEEEQSP